MQGQLCSILFAQSLSKIKDVTKRDVKTANGKWFFMVLTPRTRHKSKPGNYRGKTVNPLPVRLKVAVPV